MRPRQQRTTERRDEPRYQAPDGPRRCLAIFVQRLLENSSDLPGRRPHEIDAIARRGGAIFKDSRARLPADFPPPHDARKRVSAVFGSSSPRCVVHVALSRSYFLAIVGHESGRCFFRKSNFQLAIIHSKITTPANCCPGCCPALDSKQKSLIDWVNRRPLSITI